MAARNEGKSVVFEESALRGFKRFRVSEKFTFGELASLGKEFQKSFRVSEFQGFSVSEFQSFRKVSEFQSFRVSERVSEFQKSFRVSEFQGFRVSEFQSFRVSEKFQSFKVSEKFQSFRKVYLRFASFHSQ
jgi:hypothetical protein